MFDLGKLAFELVSQLILGIIQAGLKSSTLSFFEKRRIERRVEDATAEVVEGIIPFLKQEKVPQDKQQRLVETCISELKPFADEPAELFKGSLDGQKIFDNLYHDKDLPTVIIEDGLKDTYTLLFPRIATLLCKIPAAVKDWESEAWSENYRRFDEIVIQLKSLFARVDEIASMPNKNADTTLNLFKRTLSQKVGLQLDITGLRADQPLSGKFDDFFVLPAIIQAQIDKEKEQIRIVEPLECFSTFTTSNTLSILIGAPGAGKSTWSKWLQRETLKSDWEGIGVRIEFRDLKSENLPSIYDLIRMVAGKQLAEDLNANKIRKWLDSWQIAFIFDGFDEIRPSDRESFTGWLIEISEVAKGCPIVITSRPLTTKHLGKLGDKWKIWTIEPFDKERIVRYISKWYTNTPLLAESNRNINARDIASGWLKDPTIGPLTGNPLLLSTLLMVHHLDGKLPNGRANLYKRYIEGMLGIWDDRHKLSATDINLNPDEKRKILRGIALHLFLSETELVDENVIVEWLNTYLPKYNVNASATDVLLVLRERSGLVMGPGVYSFTHKTIAEFLVAENVLQGDQKNNFGERIDRFHLFEHRNEDRWNTVLFLWAGLAPFMDLESFINAAMKNKEYSLGFGLLYDQYDRFPLEVRQKLMLELKTLDQVDWDDNLWYVTNFEYRRVRAEETPRIQIPHFDIRSILSIEENIMGLVYTAIGDGTMLWDDYSTITGQSFGLIWSQFVGKPTDVKTWESILKSTPPAILRNSSSIRLIAHQAFQLNRNDLEELLNVYQSVFPEFKSYIPIAMMSNLALRARRELTYYNDPLVHKYAAISVEIILREELESIIPYVDELRDTFYRWSEASEQFSNQDILGVYTDIINCRFNSQVQL